MAISDAAYDVAYFLEDNYSLWAGRDLSHRYLSENPDVGNFFHSLAFFNIKVDYAMNYVVLN